MIILEDIAPTRGRASRRGIRLFPLRSAVEVQTYRDLPWPGGNAFVARNSPIGTYVSYTMTSDAARRTFGAARVHERRRSGRRRIDRARRRGRNGCYGIFDTNFKYVPPASDSGFYGPPRAPYVPPGEYTVP